MRQITWFLCPYYGIAPRVHFDPVTARAAGRPPAHLRPEIAQLFPTEFEDSTLGMVPKGWEVAEIRDRASNIQYGLTTKAVADDVGPAFLRITDIQGGTVAWENVPFCIATDKQREKYQIKEGDVVVARTGASTGENLYVVEPPDAVFASYLVRFQFNEISTARFVGAFCRSDAYFNHVDNVLSGSAQPNANAQQLSAAKACFPPSGLLSSFYTELNPLDRRIAHNNRESRDLAATRDALLPELLSGRIRLRDAERVVEEVA